MNDPSEPATFMWYRWWQEAERRLSLAESIIRQAERVSRNEGDPTNILRSYAYFSNGASEGKAP